MNQNPPIITFHNVSKFYEPGLVPAVQNLNFSIKQGEFFVIVGPSGCGKSTLLKLIAGLETQSGGELEQPTDVSMVFQSGALFPWLNVFENIALPLRVSKITEKRITEQ